MADNESGTPPEGNVPDPLGAELKPYSTNYSAKQTVCKPPLSTLSDSTTVTATTRQLENYFQLGLSPIPLKGKLPLVKWTKFNPRSVQDLKRFIKPGINFGVKTGSNLTVIDFDTEQAFLDFAVANIERLPTDVPIVKTGRGYHIWLRCKDTVRNQHFMGIDVKGEGGYVVAPPSLHPNGKRYKFLRAPGDAIPFVDLDMLEFPREKDDRQYSPKSKGKGGNTSSSETKKGFDWATIGNGVEEGHRHTFLVQFVGLLCATDHYLLDDILEITREWNSRNKPPLPDEELETTVRDCWAHWGHPVSIKTLSKEDRVLVGTDEAVKPPPTSEEIYKSRVSAATESPCPNASSPSSPTPELSSLPSTPDDWRLESSSGNVQLCGAKHRIVRKGRKYVSVAYFCGRWDCPKCSAHFKERWVKHLTEVVGDKQVYVLHCDDDDWGRIRRGMNRLEADYLRVQTNNGLIIVLDKPHPDSEPLEGQNLKTFLEGIIPTQADQCPVSTSRGWDRTKGNLKNDTYKAVTTTWLTVEDQVAVAEELGAERNPQCGNQWYSPENVNDEEWEIQFTEGIRKREKGVEKGEDEKRRLALQLRREAKRPPPVEVFL